MRKWTAKDYRTMPWKNGGGSTTELAIFPETASIDNFVWRLSTATVSQAGPFSHFAQIDRSLAILNGAGLVLKTDSGSSHEQSVTLTRESLPHRFAGEDNIFAELVNATVVDLNLMTRRDACQHFMQRLRAGEHVINAEDAQQILVFCEKGRAQIMKQTQLEAGDLVLLDEEHEASGIRIHLTAEEGSLLYVMRISFLSHHEQGRAIFGGQHGLG
ncbi:HutD/Ves family protein [Undibacterium fentianense]|uniref:HutD family protein n=1 Tax=Undibacterium fentianense TaxID=2828728 RepID=A0A941E2R4_9BURK|nr:HutD family protein [Undibacterium fentianense]MBR7801280.1 HutD family protein [Undibacterium fentianense]